MFYCLITEMILFRFSRNKCFGSQFIRLFERSHCRCLSGSFFLILTGNIAFFKYKNGGVNLKILFLNY